MSSSSIISLKLKKSLLQWYEKNQRPLPWRTTHDPYKIWISETMLQQTTCAAVIPYYQRFLQAFPTVQELARSPIEVVNQHWAGLGYYSRARNLHKAAQQIAQLPKFPNTFEELILLPGFGPYTARAVASIAFNQPVGVLDGNVIRVLTRLGALDWQWWKPQIRTKLQQSADQWVVQQCPAKINQALMELGATICTPKNPACLLCPIQSGCISHRQHKPEDFPTKKPKRSFEHWLLNFDISKKKNRFAVTHNHYAPFLKGELIFPGTAQQLKEKAKDFDFLHSITHHKIYVKLRVVEQQNDQISWMNEAQLLKRVTSSLIKKTLRCLDKKCL